MVECEFPGKKGKGGKAGQGLGHEGEVGRFNFRLRIRVLFDDGSRPEFTTMVDSHELIGEFPHAGDVWPLRFDSGDRTRVDVDLPAQRDRILTERKRIEDTHLRRVEGELGERPPD